MSIVPPDSLEDLLQRITSSLDIPDHLYENAVLTYEDVGEWLSAEDSELSKYQPEIYAQGSFRLGTVIAPWNRSGEYDVDLVCHLNIDKSSIAQRDLKRIVGDRLRARADLARMLGSSRRCWTLDYPRQFHMDVLPAIPNAENLPTGILLTDTELTRWQKSNPKGYADWFKERMKVALMERRETLAKALQKNVEDVPEWQVKTPLQRAVQLFKRHRDVYFEPNRTFCPASIIITTLAATAYRNEPRLIDALVSIATRITTPGFVDRRSGAWWIPNPVAPDENFADKWNEDPARSKAFFAWLERLKDDFAKVRTAPDLLESTERLSKSIGEYPTSQVASELGLRRSTPNLPVVHRPPQVPALGATNHCKPLAWPELRIYGATVTASVHKKRGAVAKLWTLQDRPVPAGLYLRFKVTTDAPQPYEIKWQVVNTGESASSARDLRGDFYDSDDRGQAIRWEHTKYVGTHWVEALILKEGQVIARSGPVWVRVRDR
jgi:hypothetical protein